MILSTRCIRALGAVLALIIGAAGVSVFAQLESGERGIAPIDSSSNFEVSGIAVDIAARDAETARLSGWREAQRMAWEQLWTQTHGSTAPKLGDAALDGLVSGIVVEDEQIGPQRYIARLGVLFDRVRTAELLGVAGNIRRSAPLLIIPVQYSGGVSQSFETRTQWQKAGARFRTGDSVIDYVRPTGSGADPLLLTQAQIGRPGRRWWRMLLDQYGAADVIIPQVRLERIYPGGPIVGHFSAFTGPDSRPLGQFSLRVASSAALPGLLDAGVRRLDAMFAAALADGRLRPDTSLVIEEPVSTEDLEAAAEAATDGAVASPDASGSANPAAACVRTLTLQVDTPDGASVSAVEALLRAIPGVRSAATTSIALGGVSVLRLSYEGGPETLRAALMARGFRVAGSGDTLRIRR
ncbi:MAG: heavy-metal-associated domain-containing protein [Chakrabartia sp.]